MQTLHIKGEQQLQEVVSVLLALAAERKKDREAVVVALEGELGAGKTALSKALAHELGVTEVVTSPTYVVMKKYETTSDMFTYLYHIDAYRIEDQSEMVPLKFSEVLTEEGALVCIEWASRIAPLLPLHTITVTLTPGTQEHERIVTIS